jgi:anti-sigma regulatory factor (Ser/Thr protein kinase)
MQAAPGTAVPLQTHLELAALPTAVPCARLHVRSIAREWGLEDLSEIAELLASEIVTNAIQASQRLRTRADLAVVPVVRIWLTSDGTSMIIHVWDSSTEAPVRRETTADEEHGRGLLLVKSLSKEWGTYSKLDGKVVWAMIISADP